MEGEREKDEDVQLDRLTKLPESILQEILCFLDQTSAVKTSVLSKAWRYLWCTRPKIEFTEGSTVAGDNESFCSAVDTTLQIYHDQKLRLQVFTLILSNADAAAVSLLNKWIPILVRKKNMGVESLDLTVYSNSAGNFELPSPVFESESIQNLSLRGCVLQSAPARIHLKHLQKLWFHNVHVSKQVFDKVISNCHSIEDVSLLNCSGFGSVEFLKPTGLKHIYLGNCYRIRIKAEIGSSNFQTLRSIEISDYFLSVNHNQVAFSHLTCINLKRVILMRSDLFSCGLPCLEKLTLDYCIGIKELNLLSSPSLKHLDITNINKPFVVTVDAPKIVWFCYQGVLPLSISFSAAAASYHNWKSNIILTSCWKYSHDESSLRLSELTGLLKALSQSETSLEIDDQMIQWLCNQLHNEDFEANLPIAVEHLVVDESGSISHSSSAEFLNSLFHMFRPRFIYMDFLINPNTKLHQVKEILLKERQMVQYEFWQRVLVGVSFQALYTDASEWRRSPLYTDECEWLPIQATSLPEFSEETNTSIRVQLKWRD